MPLLLTADIGGTNSRFGLFEISENREMELKTTVWLKTHDAGSLDELLAMLQESEFPATLSDMEAAVFAAPGAIVNNTRSITPNVKWEIDLNKEGRVFKKAALINDFSAQSYACKTKVMEDAITIQAGTGEHEGTLGIIGAGTGLGYGALIPLQNGYHALPSEGGHMAFPFVGAEEAEFELFARKMTGKNFCDGDAVVTGSGLSLLHEFLTGDKLTPIQVSEKLRPDSETCTWYARFYGRIARNWTLAVLGWAGVVIAGGVAAKNPMLVQSPEFIKEYVSFPKYHELLETVPISLNTNEESGLYGAALFGMQNFIK